MRSGSGGGKEVHPRVQENRERQRSGARQRPGHEERRATLGRQRPGPAQNPVRLLGRTRLTGHLRTCAAVEAQSGGRAAPIRWRRRRERPRIQGASGFRPPERHLASEERTRAKGTDLVQDAQAPPDSALEHLEPVRVSRSDHGRHRFGPQWRSGLGTQERCLLFRGGGRNRRVRPLQRAQTAGRGDPRSPPKHLKHRSVELVRNQNPLERDNVNRPRLDGPEQGAPGTAEGGGRQRFPAGVRASLPGPHTALRGGERRGGQARWKQYWKVRIRRRPGVYLPKRAPIEAGAKIRSVVKPVGQRRFGRLRGGRSNRGGRTGRRLAIPIASQHFQGCPLGLLPIETLVLAAAEYTVSEQPLGKSQRHAAISAYVQGSLPLLKCPHFRC